MPEEESAGKAALKAVEREEKAAEREEKVARREEPTAKAGQQESRRQEVSDDYLTELNRAGLNATLKAGEVMLKATGSLAKELTSFARQRLRTDVETGRSLMESGNDWNRAVELQGKFAADAVHDYLEEMTKIAQLSAQTTRDVWTPLQEFSTRLARGELSRPS